jgi:uncharacterized protein YndB with AHSA1/START domain
MATATDDRVLRLERVIKAPLEDVFEAWTQPAILHQWWGPEGAEVPEHDLDIRVGGKWRSKLVMDGDAFICSGTYRAIEPNRRLSFTWGWEGPDGSPGRETVVDVTFEAVPGGTRMRLAQWTFETTEDTEAHQGGWTSSWNKLERVLAGRPA